MAQGKCHRYSLKPGFIGPLTRKQTLRRERNRLQNKQRGKRGPKIEIASDTYYDNFVDGRGW